MSRKNTTCPICSETFHACSSCDMLDWEHRYCSRQCMVQSIERRLSEITEEFAGSLNYAQLLSLRYILEDFTENTDDISIDYVLEILEQKIMEKQK